MYSLRFILQQQIKKPYFTPPYSSPCQNWPFSSISFIYALHVSQINGLKSFPIFLIMDSLRSMGYNVHNTSQREVELLKFIRVNLGDIILMKIIHQLLVLLLVGCVASQVIGIDLGTQFWKASLISPGKNLVIVENSRSSRKSHNGIAFLEGVRHFEYDAFQKRLKKPKATYFYLNKLIESLDHTPLQGYRFENGTYYFSEGEDVLSLQQLVGMIMKNIKKFGSAQANSDIKDAVLTVPAHWGFKARMALVNAAYLADLSALGVVNENSAAAIHFAITRNDTDPVNIGFFNLGSHNLQISIVQFFGTFDEAKGKNIESLRVLSHVSVPNVGGLAVDQVLAEYAAAQFEAKHKLNVRNNEKAWVKLLHKCSDAKEVLSANKEVNVYIEALIDGIDLNLIIKRDVLEQAPLFSTIREKLQEAVQKAGISKDQVQSVEVIGGASRIPIVNKIVKEFFDPVEVGSHINGDESMAFGSALRAANLSIAFRVKQLHFYDGYPEQVRAVVSNVEDGVIAESVIFDKDSEQGLKKELVVNESTQDLKVTIFYGEDIIHEYAILNVSQWKTKYNESQLNITETPKVILTFIANSITVAELKEAYVNITLNTSTTKEVYELVVENVTVEETPQAKTEETEKTEGEAKEENKAEETEKKTEESEKNAEQAEKSEEGEKKGEKEGSEEKPEETASEEKKPEGDEQAKTESKKKRNRERTKTVKKLVDDFKIQNKKYSLKLQAEFAKYKKFTKEQIEALQEATTRYEKHENYLKEKAKVRNDFESTLYSLKDDFENPGLKTFSTEAELQKLKESVAEELAWLEENAWTAQKIDFQKHYRSIQRVYDPIVNRSLEYRERESAYNKTIDILSLVYSKTAELNVSQPWVSEKALNHLKKINETFEQIQSKLKKQIDRKLNENIIFYNNEMIDKAEDLRDEYYLIKMIPRPKVVKKPVLVQEQAKPAEAAQEEPKQEAKQEAKEQSKEEEKEQSKEEAKVDEGESGDSKQEEEKSREDL